MADSYDAFFASREEEHRARTQTSVGLHQDINPDQFAEARTLAQRTGLPVDAVMGDVDDVKRRERAQTIAQNSASYPILARQLQDPEFAKLAHDDVEVLGDAEQKFNKAMSQGRASTGKIGGPAYQRPSGTVTGEDRSFVGGFVEPVRRGYEQGRRGLYALMEQAGAFGGMQRQQAEAARQGGVSYTPGVSLGVAMAEQQRKIDAYPIPESIQAGMQEISGATTIGGAVTSAVKNPRAVLEVALQSLGVSAPALAMSVAGSTAGPMGTAAGAGAGSFAIEYGNTLNEVMEERGVDSRNSLSIARALENPEIMAAARDKALKRSIPVAVFDALTAGLAGKLLGGAKPTVASYLTRAAGETGVQAGGGAAGEAIAQAATGEYKPGDIVMEALAEMPSALVEVPGNIRDARAKAKTAEGTNQILTGMQELAASSKLTARAPEVLADFMQEVATQHGAPDVRVQAQVFNQSLIAVNIDPETVLAKLPEDVRASYAEALATGGDVVIPTGEAVSKLLTSEEGAALVPHLRFGEDDMSFAEREQFKAGEQGAFEAEMQAVIESHRTDQAWQDSSAVVEQSVRDQLLATGATKDAANKQAALHTAFASVMAERLGVTPEQYHAQRPLTIAREESTATPARSLFGRIGDAAKSLLQRVTGTEPAQASVQPMAMPTAQAIAQKPITAEESAFFRAQGIDAAQADPALVQRTMAESGWNVTGEEDGLPVWGNDRVSLSSPRDVTEAHDVFYIAPEGLRAVKYDIKDADGRTVGDVVLELDGDWPTRLLDIGVNREDRNAGTARSVVGAILADVGEIGIWNITDDAAEWWGKTGVQVGESQMGRLTAEQFAVARAGSPNARGVEGAVKRVYHQGDIARGTFSPDTNTITLTPNANLSTFLHESGHYFLESYFDASGSQLAGESLKRDEQTLLEWFGLRDRAEWDGLSFEERRAYHEQFAVGFEKYLMEGKAPSIELQSVFRTFRAWLVQVYRALKNLDVQLSDDVRAVMDRMLASEEDIAAAEMARSQAPMFATAQAPMFATAQAAGMTEEEFAQMHAKSKDATDAAIEKMQGQALRDLKWLRGAQNKTIKALQKEAAGIRTQIEMDVRRDVMARPVYQAWQWLTGKVEIPATAVAPRKSDPEILDPTIDSLHEAIAKLGGLSRESAASLWGMKPEEKSPVRMFGKPVMRAEGKGMTVDRMAEALAQYGYIEADENSNDAIKQFEEAFFDELNGSPIYSNQYEYQREVKADEADTFDPMAGGRLDRASMIEIYGRKNPIIAQLESMRMLRKDGWHPDILAEQIDGFASGDDMVRSLANAPAPKDVIASETDARMLMENGELATPEAIQGAADEAVFNEARARFVSAELNALATISKHQKIPREAAQTFARSMIERLRIENIKPSQYRAAAARAAKASQEASKKGDTATAMSEKRNQLVQTYAAQYASEAVAERKAIEKRFKDVIGGKDADIAKRRDMDLVNVARLVLLGYGYATTKTERAAKYVEAIREYDTELADHVAGVLSHAAENGKPVEKMTMEELRGLDAEVDGIWHLAKRNRSMELDGDLLDHQDAAAGLRERMEAVGIPENGVGESSAPTDIERALLKIGSIQAALKRVEAWALRMDGGKLGPFMRYVFLPVKEAADRYRTDKAKRLKGLRDALAPIRESFKRGKIAAPEIGHVFGEDSGGVAMNELFHAILHTGNESNKRKLLLGRQDKYEDGKLKKRKWAPPAEAGKDVDSSRWDAFLQRMINEGQITKKHFDAAQAVWDLLEDTKPLAQKAHRDAFGYYFDEVSAGEFTVRFPDGTQQTYRGGYVPANADSRIVQDKALRELIEAGKESMVQLLPQPAKGFTKSRVEYNRPLMLDVRAIGQHIDKVLLFSHMEMPVRDVSRMVRMPQVAEPLGKMDPAAITGLIIPWLNRASVQRVTTSTPGLASLDKLATTLRSRVGMAVMFGNLSNAVQQVAGFPLAFLKAGPGYMVGAAAEYFANPSAHLKAVSGASEYMRARLQNEAEAMHGEVLEILTNPTTYQSAQQFTQRHAYFLQSSVDSIMGPIIWQAAYDKATSEGLSHRDAVRMGDSAIRTTQGSTLAEDVSRAETCSPFVRIFTQFYGYFNMEANLLASEYAARAEEHGKARAAMAVLTAFLASAVVAEGISLAFKGGPDDKDKDGEYLDDWLMALFNGVVKNTTATVPFAGPAVQYAINKNLGQTSGVGERLSFPPVLSFLESSLGSPDSVYGAMVEDKNASRAVKDAATAISMATGLPAFFLARPASYQTGVEQGRIKPTSPADYTRGLITGTASPESKRQ